MSIHIGCDIKDCDSVKEVDHNSNLPEGWSEICTMRKVERQKLSRKRGVPQYGEMLTAHHYMVCDKHELPEPKPGASNKQWIPTLLDGGSQILA